MGPSDLDLEGVQTLLFTGFGRLPHTSVVTFRFGPDVRGALQTLTERLRFGTSRSSPHPPVHLLLSGPGLEACGATPDEVREVSRELAAGMNAEPSRLRLGDAPAVAAPWGWTDRSCHGVVLAYGRTPEEAAELACTVVDQAGLEAGFTLALYLPDHQREHFGFRDGLINVRLAAAGAPSADVVADGELLMGRPGVHGEVSGRGELALDSTLIVLRQLEQDVETFWDQYRAAASGADAVALAAKAMGRWPNGMPLQPGQTREPALQDPIPKLDFARDARGVGCPLGAHVRRGNPRTSLAADEALSLKISAQHRLLRRGRVYGPPARPGAYPPEIGAIVGDPERPDPDDAARGLLLVAGCADLRRQFEFVQQSWLGNPKFLDLPDEVDPILATGPTSLSIPTDRFRRVVHGLGGTVRTRAGGYFLLPHRRALGHLMMTAGRAGAL